MAKVTQKQRVLQYIKDFGSITSWQAYEDLGVMQLGTRIFELKKAGIKIKKERVTKLNRYGDKCHFDKYMLAEE